jgi:tetratricopeptide (TPR) repeat protein
VKRVTPFLLAAVAFFVTSARAHAEDAQLARQHYDKGVTLYDLGQYHEAAKEYEEAYKFKSDPALLFNIGQAYRNANEPADALRAYRAYLRRSPDARNRADVEGYIARMQKAVDEQHAATPPPPTTPPATTTPPPTATTPPTTSSTMTSGTTMSAATSGSDKPPLYKRWWLWAAVGGVVVAGVVVGVAVAYTTPKDAPAPSNAFGVTF